MKSIGKFSNIAGIGGIKKYATLAAGVEERADIDLVV